MTHVQEEASSVRLAPVQTIKTCCELADWFRLHVRPNAAVVVDAAEFAEGDITTVQILLAARRSSASLSCSFTIENGSPEFSALLQRSGVAAV